MQPPYRPAAPMWSNSDPNGKLYKTRARAIRARTPPPSNYFSIVSSSTSNTSVAPGLILGGEPRSP